MNQTEQIPEGWEEKSLSQTAKVVKGVTYKSEEYAERGEGAVFINLKCILKSGGFNRDGVKYFKGKIKKEQILHSGDIIIAAADLTREGDIIGYPLIVPTFGEDKTITMSMDVVKLEPFGTSMEKRFLYYRLCLPDAHEYMRKISGGSTVLHLSIKKVRCYKFGLPKSLTEQQKIAHILLTVDQAIDKTNDLIEKHKKIKQGLMRDIFDEISASQKISFKDKRYVSLITKGTTPTTYGYSFVDNGINFVKVECISEDGHFIQSQFQHIDEKANQFLKRSQLREGDILFSIAGALGRCVKVDKKVLPANTNQALAILRFKNGVNVDYVKHVLDSVIIQEHIKKITVQLAQANLSLENISKFEIPFPSPEKQREIVKNLSAITHRIESEESYLSKLLKIKTGLMQDLLTGKVRVAA